MRTALSALLLLSIIFIPGCSRIPQKEIETLRRTLEAAKAADADLFAKEKFSQARELFDSAATIINNEQLKLPFASDYSYATELLTTAIAAAHESIRESRESRVKQRTITDSLIGRAKAMAQEAKSGLVSTRKVGPAVRDSLRHVADSAAGMSQRAATAFAKDQIGDAAEGASAAIALIQPVWKLVAPKRDTMKTH